MVHYILYNTKITNVNTELHLGWIVPITYPHYSTRKGYIWYENICVAKKKDSKEESDHEFFISIFSL